MSTKIRLLFLTIIYLSSLATMGQTTIDIYKLKKDFVTDSLGCLGQRLAYIDTATKYLDTLTNKTNNIILIAGINLINQKSDTLETLLGKPNNFAERSEATKKGEYYSIFVIDHFWYYLTTCGKDKKGIILVVSAFNGIIGDIDIIKN